MLLNISVVKFSVNADNKIIKGRAYEKIIIYRAAVFASF